MDKIIVNGMEFYGYHGVFKEEEKLGQRFKVNVSMAADLRAAGRSDDLDQTVNYADVYTICKDIVEGKPYKLIEAVAEEIASMILKSFALVQQVTVKVIKPNPPIHGIYEHVAVEIIRDRENE